MTTVTSHTTREFRSLFAALPPAEQRAARKAYALWRADPAHPSLQFKKIHSTQPVYSIRVSLGWRAVGVRDGDSMIWFFVGPHAEYDRLIENL